MQEDQERVVRQKALELQGPGAATRGFQAELRRWFTRSITLESKAGDDFGPEESCEECGAIKLCEGCIADMIDDDMPRGRVFPTAFRIHRDEKWCERDESFFLIDAVLVGSREQLRKAFPHWIQFGSDIDRTDKAFLRLRLFDESFVQIAEYDHDDLFEMDIAPDIGFDAANDRL